MNFRTNIQLQKEHHQIDYQSKLLLIGSCFSENISAKLNYFKFHVKSNPFGILFNPKTIETLIANAINEKIYTEDDVFELNNRWHCFNAHSDCSANSEEKILLNLNSAISLTKERLKNASHLIITLGTSSVYRHIESDTIVGNCHKVSQKKFLQELLSVKQIIASLENIILLVKSVNPTINIIFTVSPVRHLKDGFVENTQSKSHLISAIHQLLKSYKHSFCSAKPPRTLSYFPSYEIMMDDLRDYRFYNEDMVHPNQQAINYIWEQFQHVWIDENALSTMNEVETIQKGLAHKPFNPNSEQHQEFLLNLQLKIDDLKLKNNILF